MRPASPFLRRLPRAHRPTSNPLWLAEHSKKEGEEMKSRRFFLIFLFGLGLVSEASAGDTKILINHIGYDSGGVKQAVIQGSSGGAWSGFKVIEAGTGKVAPSGTAVCVGSVQKWKDRDFWTLDFSHLNRGSSNFI